MREMNGDMRDISAVLDGLLGLTTSESLAPLQAAIGGLDREMVDGVALEAVLRIATLQAALGVGEPMS